MTVEGRDALLRDLYRSLDERWRPEDVARAIIELRGHALSAGERELLSKKVKGSHRGSFAWWQTSMSRDFMRPVGAERQLAVARGLFDAEAELDPDSPSALEQFIARASV